MRVVSELFDPPTYFNLKYFHSNVNFNKKPIGQCNNIHQLKLHQNIIPTKTGN